MEKCTCTALKLLLQYTAFCFCILDGLNTLLPIPSFLNRKSTGNQASSRGRGNSDLKVHCNYPAWLLLLNILFFFFFFLLFFVLSSRGPTFLSSMLNYTDLMIILLKYFEIVEIQNVWFQDIPVQSQHFISC